MSANTARRKSHWTKTCQLKFGRSNRPEAFCKKGVLKNFIKFTGKHLFQSLFFNKVVGLTKFRRTSFLHNTSGRLLL